MLPPRARPVAYVMDLIGVVFDEPACMVSRLPDDGRVQV